MQPHPQIAEQESVANETIVAISTPPGRGGIGIVRLSGPHASKSQRAAHAAQSSRPRTRRFAEIYDPETQQKLDEAIVTLFAAPNSYTGEDLVEIAAHGSPVILELLVRQSLAAGARLARPGEFTERAFLSGRIDLTQAEAVRDLIESQTLYQARIAAEQMGGALSRRIQPAKAALVELIALLEAGIDFAEDDVDVTPDAEIADSHRYNCALEKLARSFDTAASCIRAHARHRRPAECGQIVALQSPRRTRARHRHRHARHHARPGHGACLLGRHSARARRHRRPARSHGRGRIDRHPEIPRGARRCRPGTRSSWKPGIPMREDESDLIESLPARRALIARNKSDLT